MPERDLIVRMSITTSANTRTLVITSRNEATCPKCGAFKKSGRLSCCAPGGTWYAKCGGNRNADYSWSEGAQACKHRKSRATPL